MSENTTDNKLPQPRGDQPPYEYVLYEQIEERFFRGRLQPGSLCWVLKGKSSHGNAHKLFLRARVVEDTSDDSDTASRRVLIRYPKGSTYRVKRSNLVPVLEGTAKRRIVLLMAETPDYRRAAMVHTCIGDSFLEIGCDFGPCVDRVQRALREMDDVGIDGPKSLPEPGDGRVWCLGIDKSPDSIDIAVKRFPDCTFSIEDALEDNGVKQLQELCRNKLQHGYPSVVAVDINGNREIPAVLQCVDHIMNPPTLWTMPRIILVKSRLLHVQLRSVSKEEEA